MPTNNVSGNSVQRVWSSLLGRASSGAVLQGDPDRTPVATSSALPTRPDQVTDRYAQGAPAGGRFADLLGGRSYTNRG